ncbi:MAG: histidine kinase [Bacteroidota bacterium]
MRGFLTHAGIWIGVYVVYTYMTSYYDDLRVTALVNILNVFLFALAYYLLKYVQIPYLYEQKKVILFVISLLASAFVLSAFCRMNGYLWMDNLHGKNPDDIPFMTPGSYLLKSIRFYTPALAFLAWEAHMERKKDLNRMQLLEKEKITNELKFLKAQINPHFLFNTLNNLYSYVQTQSPKAPKMIIYLSGILDYVLYKSQQERVPLKEEVDTIKKFIKLESIRYGDRLTVHLKEDFNGHSYISPLILLSIVENAFKHGASGDIDSPTIKVDISDDEDSIYCRVWNTKSQYTGKLNDEYKEGIGLNNLIRQLDLIYPETYKLTVKDEKDSFSLSVQLQSMYEKDQMFISG